MRPANKPKVDPTITRADVLKWFASGHKPWPSEARCAEIAERLNNMRWPNDPLLPFPRLADNEWRVQFGDIWRPETYNADPWWDSEKATARAKALLDDIPAMLRHWHRMQGTRFETLPGQKPMHLRGGYDAIDRLRVALDAALPYIEFPVGEYKRQDHRTKKRPKPWHAHAAVIAPMIAGALRQAGHEVIGASHNTALVRIVREALFRIGYGTDITASAVAKQLTSWFSQHGRKL